MNGQHVVFNKYIISDYVIEFAKLFYMFSNVDNVNKTKNEYNLELDESLKPIVSLIEIGANKRFNISYYNTTKKQQFIESNNNIIVCFSGGKDSTAAALKMQKLGFNVFLYYLQGVNKSYPDELDRAKSIAKKINLPLHIEKISLKGVTTFHDNPVKNQLIASMALEWGVENKIGTKICFGDFTDDNIYNSSFLEAWSDTQEMWKAHENYIRQFIPTYEIIIPFENYRDTLDIISNNETLLNDVQGCVLPHRFRNKTKIINENKYNLKILPYRCGSCWKCCVEYIFLADKGIIEYNELFYKHCLVILSNKMSVLHANVKAKDIKTTYETFLMQNFENSQIWKHLH